MTEAHIETPPIDPPTRRQVIIGTTVAMLVAAVGMVFFILPAESDIDITGFGEATGLTGLARSGQPGFNIYLERGLKRKNVLFALDAQTVVDETNLEATLIGKGLAVPAGATMRTDKWVYELLPYEGIETKYKLAQGQPMIYAWNATGQVHYDMHSVPGDPGKPEDTESFSIGDANAQAGVYVAPFTGIHGFYWQNQSLEPVTVTIEAVGGFTGAVIFNQSGEYPRPLSDETTPAAAENAQP